MSAPAITNFEMASACWRFMKDLGPFLQERMQAGDVQSVRHLIDALPLCNVPDWQLTPSMHKALDDWLERPDATPDQIQHARDWGVALSGQVCLSFLARESVSLDASAWLSFMEKAVPWLQQGHEQPARLACESLFGLLTMGHEGYSHGDMQKSIETLAKGVRGPSETAFIQACRSTVALPENATLADALLGTVDCKIVKNHGPWLRGIQHACPENEWLDALNRRCHNIGKPLDLATCRLIHTASTEGFMPPDLLASTWAATTTKGVPLALVLTSFWGNEAGTLDPFLNLGLNPDPQGPYILNRNSEDGDQLGTYHFAQASPLQVAVLGGKTQALQTLLSHGADVNLPCDYTYEGQPRHAASCLDLFNQTLAQWKRIESPTIEALLKVAAAKTHVNGMLNRLERHTHGFGA